ncbi:MAG: hypothetical protein ACOYOP_09465 [Microthrixaceae bacterium]
MAMVAGVLAACAPSAPSGPSAQQQFCNFYEKATTAPPTADQAVLVKDQVVAKAEDTTVSGSSCTSSNAKVTLDGATLAEGTEVAEKQDPSSTTKVAAITGDEIKAAEPVLDNLSVQALSADIGPNGITLRGNVNVTLSGTTSTIGFVGTLANLDNWSVNLSSTSFVIPGITTSPLTFNGTLTVVNGVPSLSLTAAAASVKVGDVTVTNATLKVTASPAAGVAASIQGSLKIGPSTVSGTVDVAFDPTGTLISAKADISAHLVGTMAGGKKADLTGTVKIRGNAQETSISFSASGILGDLQVNEANGSLTLASNKATFVGKIDVNQGGNFVRFDGSIVWDGVTAYTPFLNLQGGGSFSGTLNDGQVVSVDGTVDTTIVGGQLRAVVTGNFKIGTLKAAGTAIVETNGATTTLNVDANLTGAGFNANIQGVVVITDGIAETVQLDANVIGPLQLGDATLTGATLSVRSTYGSPLELKFSGGLSVGSRVNLLGDVAASFGPNGTLLSLTGNLSGSLALDSWGLLDFNGAVVANSQKVTLTGAGSLTTTNFPLGVTFRGTFTSSLLTPSWSLAGSGKLQIIGLTIASARLTLSQAAGMKATSAGFYISIIGIPTYLEADFYMKPEGGCSKVQLTGGSFLARPLATLILPGLVGCPVYN